jgi:hypothetical protein
MKTRNDVCICRPQELEYLGWSVMARDEYNGLVCTVTMPALTEPLYADRDLYVTCESEALPDGGAAIRDGGLR